MSFPPLVIGAGAAGLFAASRLRNALVLERTHAPGRKLLVTGGGRCNLVHEGDPAAIADAFGVCARFVRPAFLAFPPDAQKAWFADAGLRLSTESGGFVYPVSNRAEDVLSALLSAVRRAGSRIECGARVARILLSPDGDAVRGVALADSRTLASDRVILAAGGAARPSLGTDGSAFRLARDIGLRVETPLPALGALRTDTPWSRPLAGLTLPDAVLRLRKGTPGAPPRGIASRGGLLFTAGGFSGPAALNLSGDIAAALASGAAGTFLSASWRADRPDPAAWSDVFRFWRETRGAALVRNLLAGELPRSLAAALCSLAGVPGDSPAARLRQDDARRLAEICAACPLPVSSTAGFNDCMATRGGVSIRELNPATLECRRIRGLHVVGEAAEPVGPCGGYNLSWAWASAFAATCPSSLSPSQ